MYARMTTFHTQPGTIDEAIHIVQNAVLPAVRQQPGFKGGLALADYSTGKLIGITLWETEADMLASEANGYYREQVGKIGSFLAGQPVREAYVAGIAEGVNP
ncbi:MAG: antibiotic biosynthesis monooxygenase family protein [Roseiflexaceae bacterium]